MAINCPYLWTNLTFTREVKRSKMASLVVNARLDYIGSKSTLAVHMAMNHISRVREFILVGTTASLGHSLRSVPESASMLQTLALSCLTSSHADMRHDNYTIPPELFSDDTSRLRRLELIHCNATSPRSHPPKNSQCRSTIYGFVFGRCGTTSRLQAT